ncbi:class I SAM-dependent methyltransferase family protein [Candidatus Woesearchaeota archaeon]|nr:class I SAM-dependent methyltransferase family protein [Candidatus Woesearchaeota archaeon]
MKCVKVGLKHAEKVKIELIRLGVFSNNYYIAKDKDFIYLPVIKNLKNYNVVNKKLIKREKLSLEDVLRKKLNKKEFKLLVNSYDVVGSVAVLEIDKNLVKKAKTIANALLKTNKNIKTVVMKSGEHEGKYRIQKCKYLAGVKKFYTLHKESGIVLKLNINKTYYSVRSSNERLRIAKSVRESETVLVMFSGIGVYPLVISKHSKAKEVYGVEINPDACKYAGENVKLNRAPNVKLFCGDVKAVVPQLNKKFDRIIMPLPKDSIQFLGLALENLNKKGVINFYCFSREDEIMNFANKISEEYNVNILSIFKCGQKSPRIYRYCIDFQN